MRPVKTQIRKSPVELFIAAFVRQNRKGIVGVRFIQKAIAMINDKLNGTETADAVTQANGLFTTNIKLLLQNTSRAGNEESLNRAKALLQAFIA